MMTRSFLRLCIVSGVIGAPEIAAAFPPATPVRTASVGHELFFRTEFSLILERGNDIEGSIFHPEAMKLFVGDMFLPWLGAFGFAQLGKGRGEGFVGVVFRPPLEDAITLDVGIGGGLGVGGIPIPGWYIQCQSEDRVYISSMGLYHYLTGWNQDLLFRFRPWHGWWFFEPWFGMFASIAGKHEIFDSPEAGLSASALMRWPLHTLLTFGWPVWQGEDGVEPRFRLSLELQFPVRW